MAQVVIYTTRVCAFCLAAKRIFDARGIDYEEVDVSDDPDRRSWLRDATGQRTVPQIFIEGRPVGGYAEVAALDGRGELVPLLAR